MTIALESSSLGYEVAYGIRKKLPKLIELKNESWKTQNTFGEPADDKDGKTSYFADLFFLDTDADDNICLSFGEQNRIEKYAPDGKLLCRMDRPLNYTTGVIEKEFIVRGPKGGGVQAPKMNSAWAGIAADGKSRIWVITYNRQISIDERGSGGSTVSTGAGVVSRKRPSQPKVVNTDVFKLEVFSPDGLLLGEIPLAHHAHHIRIFGDDLFIGESCNAVFFNIRSSRRRPAESDHRAGMNINRQCPSGNHRR